jgi:hypothetical protein
MILLYLTHWATWAPSINATFVTSRNTTKVLVPLTPSFRGRNERLNEFIILITGRHNIAEILLNVVLNTKIQSQIRINRTHLKLSLYTNCQIVRAERNSILLICISITFMMNGLCHFFYILELKLGNIYFTTTVIQQNHIGVKKLHDSPY